MWGPIGDLGCFTARAQEGRIYLLVLVITGIWCHRLGFKGREGLYSPSGWYLNPEFTSYFFEHKTSLLTKGNFESGALIRRRVQHLLTLSFAIEETRILGLPGPPHGASLTWTRTATCPGTRLPSSSGVSGCTAPLPAGPAAPPWAQTAPGRSPQSGVRLLPPRSSPHTGCLHLGAAGKRWQMGEELSGEHWGPGEL